MALSDMIATLDNYMEVASQQPYPEVIVIDVAALKAVLPKVSLPLPGVAQQKLHSFLAHLLKRSVLQARTLMSFHFPQV